MKYIEMFRIKGEHLTVVRLLGDFEGMCNCENKQPHEKHSRQRGH